MKEKFWAPAAGWMNYSIITIKSLLMIFLQSKKWSEGTAVKLYFFCDNTYNILQKKDFIQIEKNRLDWQKSLNFNSKLKSACIFQKGIIR